MRVAAALVQERIREARRVVAEVAAVLCGLLGFADLLRCLAFGDAALVLVFGLIIAFMGKAARNDEPGDVELAGPGGGAAPTAS